MDFVWAAGEIKTGKAVQLKSRKGGKVIIKSAPQAFDRMSSSDFLSEDWEPYLGKKGAQE